PDAMKEQDLRSWRMLRLSEQFRSSRRPAMGTEYDGPQIVGMDLHRRQLVLVRMTLEGVRLGKVRIVNSPGVLREEISKAGRRARRPPSTPRTGPGWCGPASATSRSRR